jgi:hypothetical protein
MTTWTEYREELAHISATAMEEFMRAMEIRETYPKNDAGYVAREWENKSIQECRQIEDKATQARQQALAKLLATPADQRGPRL